MFKKWTAKQKRSVWLPLTIALLCLTLVAWGGRIGQTEDAVRLAAILTTGYVASSTFDIDRANQLDLQCFTTIGSATAIQVKVEFTQNKTNWVQETDVQLAGGVATHQVIYHRWTATGNYDISIPVNARHYRVSVLAEDDATGTELAITGVKSRL